VPALIPLVYNGCIIAGGLLLGSRGMEGFCWGVLVGAILGSFALPLLAARTGEQGTLRYRPLFRHADLKRFILLALPLMLGQSVVVLDEQLLRVFGSLTVEGAVSWLNYARRVMLVPVGVVAQAAGVQRFVHVSSPGVLGPIHNPPANETWPHAPSNIYEATKSEGEKLALAFAQRTNLSLTVVRPEFVYGPSDTHVLGLFRAIQKRRFFFIGSGENRVHPTFVDDAVQGMMLCETNGQAGRTYLIAGPEPASIRHLATTIASALSVSPPRLRLPRPLAAAAAAGLELASQALSFQPPLSRSAVNFFTETRVFSTARAQAELGYQAQVPLVEGVRRTVEWYREQGLL